MKIANFTSLQFDLAEATKIGYAKDLKAYEQFKGGEEPTVEGVQQYVRWLQKSKKSSAHISRSLYALKKYCWFYDIDIFKHIKPPPLEFRQISHTLSEDEVKRLMDSADSLLETLTLRILFTTGMRIGEMLNIQLEDIDFDKGIVKIKRKGRRERLESIPLFPSVVKDIKEYAAGATEGKLFTVSYIDLYWMLRKLASKAKVKFPKYSFFHNLRHAFTIYQRLQGVSIEDISQALGHSSINVTTKVYGMLEPEELRKALKEPKI